MERVFLEIHYKFFLFAPITRESVVARDVGRQSFTGSDGIVIESGGCCSGASPSSGLKTSLLSKVVFPTGGSQKVLARCVAVYKVSGSSADGVECDSVDNRCPSTY